MSAPQLPFGVPTMAPSFSTGFDSGRDVTVSPGLAATDARWAAMTQERLGKPAPSVLAQARPSNLVSNATAPSMQDRIMPDGSLMSSANGTAEGTYQGDTQLRLRGVLPL